MWNIILKFGTGFFQKVVQEDTARYTIAIIVAPDGNSFSRKNCRPESLCGEGHILHQERIMQMQVVRRIQKFLGILFRQNAAPREERGGEIVIQSEFLA